jgi:hypothetical protein
MSTSRADEELDLQTKLGQSTATMARQAHHWVWNMISRMDGVATHRSVPDIPGLMYTHQNARERGMQRGALH